MPNIAALLREEISRLSRKEVRRQVEVTKKASTQHRRHIAALRRQVARLERQISLLSRRVGGNRPAAAADANTKRMRFVAKGLRSQRGRLDLSAGEYGKLVGVSAQSIYNWERGVAHPRGPQLAALAALRSIGKKEARVRLEQLGAQAASKGRKS